MTRRSPARMASLLTTALVAWTAAPALGYAAESRLAVSVMGEAAFAPEVGGRGAVLVGGDITEIGEAGLSFSAVLNTDTLRLQLGDIVLAHRLWLELDAAGELGFASLLPDYFLYGQKHPERGFFASYVEGGATLVWSPGAAHWLRIRAGVRRWLFGAMPDTSSALRLPDDFTHFAPTLAYTLWMIEESDEFSEQHRLFPRVEGFALGVELGLSLRTNNAPWGMIDPALDDPANPAFLPAQDGRAERNRPDALGFRPQGWVRLGTWLTEGLRWQVLCEGAYGLGGDDVTRQRVGGSNPYVVALPGLAWGSFASERYAAADWSWHMPVAGESEAGLRFAGMYLDDIERTGASRGGALFGASAFADMRFGDWQVDARLGWSPAVPKAGGEVQNGVSALVGVGFSD